MRAAMHVRPMGELMLRIHVARKAALFFAVLLLILNCLFVAPVLRDGLGIRPTARPWSRGPDKLACNTMVGYCISSGTRIGGGN